MKKIAFLVLVLFNTYLLADFVTIYRTMGIDEVQKELDKQLKSEKYWSKYLENIDVRYGYYESKKYVLVADKLSKKFELFKREDKKFLKILTQTMISGEKDGDKFLEGDLKTPIGAYKLTRKLTKLDQFYGPLALVTNYPNTFDKSLNKEGHGIWIHGMPYEESRSDYTKGCIALDNESLVALDKSINYDESVLLISEKDIEPTTKKEMSEVLAFIFSWTDAWRVSDTNTYLSYYSKDFKRANGQNFDAFKKHKEYIFSRKEDKTIKFSNINIMPYPNSFNKKMFKIVMDEHYKTNSYQYDGIKELYIQLEEGKISILSEG
ncbi:ErfK/YbiS/YcfS/YnhG family protein [Arcobacter nitrofigilis DSM 7299]|uniref:ErfK/YbiS/YcfS/YnhG family protein n=1 Tax=Arcobacter nitrofigilis (strain ATCC 33309 / DSM 7299 / CCUG 15893 / LMG 7604 / NCTC 12251 / CI) TaxID=572480 RepID=D5V196_ARCNC|nr:L,D-transpeptidase family protein [Arcobacter nitrofigilis]ADG94058.1 ErfK/YbiS/YcfS/YnhG family protein [Arcobacter nitrofigilis DSM 7299]